MPAAGPPETPGRIEAVRIEAGQVEAVRLEAGQVEAVRIEAGQVTAGRLEAAERLERVAPGYLALVRRAALRLAHRDGAAVDLLTALADVRDAAELDIEVPTLSRLRIGRWVKMAIRQLVGWYLRYLTGQVNAFANAVTRFGTVLVERTDRLEEATAAVAADLERLRRRVEHLERAGAAASGEEPAGASGEEPAGASGEERSV